MPIEELNQEDKTALKENRESEEAEARESRSSKADDGLKTKGQEQVKEQVKEQAKAEEKEDKKPPEGFVPHGAFHEERERRKRLESEVAESRRKMETMETRFQSFVQGFQPKPPAIEQDPVGYFQHTTEELNKKIADLEKFKQEASFADRLRSDREQFLTSYRSAASQYSENQPDFAQAYQFLSQGRIGELMEAGYDYNAALILATQDEERIVAKAFQDGVNPAERMYKLAVKRGYARKESGNSAQEKLATIEKGQRASPEFSPASKGKPKMTLAQIADLPDDEFAKLDWEKVVGNLAS